MARLTFEKRDTYLTFRDRNRDNKVFVNRKVGYITNEDGKYLTTENGEKLIYFLNVPTNPLVVRMKKRDTVFVFYTR